MDPREVRLQALFQTYGKTIILPYDQGLEHGPRDFFNARFAENPLHIIEIAKKGNYNAIALHIGNARRYFKDMYNQVPLILKVNGKTEIPSDDEPLSPITATIEEAVQLSAIAVGYTLYIGSPRQDEDIEQFTYVREEAHRAGLPVIVWSYPRGQEIEEKGGKNSLYAVEYAARVAAELGADMIKVNVPNLKKNSAIPAPYRDFEIDLQGAVKRIIGTTAGVPVIFAGGEMVSDEDLLQKATVCMRAGGSGFIFGRNIWQRPLDKALDITRKIKEVIRTERLKK
ncbi:MAG: class I fructose-bisphosphate aldolase [Syntrophorhabdaceae bacterium]